MSIRIPKPFDRRTRAKKVKSDLGIDDTFISGRARLLHKDGTFNVTRKGKKSFNLYKFLMQMSWTKFFLLLFLAYISINSFFGLLYSIEGAEGIYGMEPGSWAEEFIQSFFLSVQTFTTVGYGKLNPESMWANVISVANAFIGLMSFALATGLFFAKWSSPTHEILFSNRILVSKHEGKKALMVRFINGMDNHIVDLKARITMTWVTTIGTKFRRKFALLDLELDHIYMFPLNWTLVHIIDENSPLNARDLKQLEDNNTEFLLVIKGYDVTYGKAIHIARSYNCEDLVYGASYVPMYETTDDETIINLDQIDDIEKIQLKD
ncbi:MAG: hypothetical protein HKN68_01675 [Saprospiraceae bacterium]|nr:hypothetical protein [Saprospiraceae bacterium]